MKLSRLLALALFLILVFPARGNSNTGEISDAEIVSFVKNTWGWTQFADNVIITKLDGAYDGLPYRDEIKMVIVGLELQHFYESGQDSEAMRVILNYAGKLTINSALKSVGLRGVAAVASAASWPIEWGLARFRTAVRDKGYNTEKALYFAVRARDHELAEILSADNYFLFDADGVNSGEVMKFGGWLRPANVTDLTVPSIPGMTPVDAFSAFETEWLCKNSAADFDEDNDTLREAFGRALRPAAPTITTDLVDQTIVDGQSATFTVAARGTGPFQYVWEMNGSPILVAIGPTFTAAAAAQYRVTVYDAGNLSVRSRAATLTVLPPGAAVTLTAPGIGATAGGTYTVRASASGASKIEFWLDGVRRSTDTSAPFTWPWNTALEDNGSHQLVAKAYNGATLLGTTPARTVTVNNTAATGNDPYEPNNSSLTATVIGLGESRTAYVGSPSDVDWFRVQVTVPGVITFDLSVPTSNDYDIELFGPDAAYINGSYRDTGLAESIMHNAVVTGTYWVRIYGYPIGNGSFSATNAYTLTTQFTSGAITITNQPQDTSIPWGACASFSASATAATNSRLFYQWRRNGIDIPGATSATYVTPPTNLGQNGDQITVRISGTFGSVISTAATLNVTDPAAIYWTGAVSNDWNTPGNWNLQRIPVGGDVVRISSASVQSSNVVGSYVIAIGSSLTVTGTFGNNVTVASGSVLNINGAAAKILGGTFNNSGTVNWNGGDIQLGSAVITNLSGGTFNVLTSASMYHAFGGVPSFANAGIFRKSADPGTAYLSGVAFTNTGLVELQSGSLYVGGSFTNTGLVELQNCSLNVSGFTQLSGKIALWGGTLNVSQGLQLMGGELSGVGLVNGTLNNTGGVVRPGIGIGTLIVVGAYSQSATGTLVLEIKPTMASIEYDWFVVTGLATLGGAVQIQLVNGSSPVLGQTFVPITFGSRSGTFSSLEVPVFGQDLTFDASLSATTFSLSVVRTAFGTWKQTKFGADASNTAIAGAMSDPDHDGTPNLLEFAFGMEPLLAGRMNNLPYVTQVTVNSQNYLAIRFRRLTGASPGVSYTVQESTNLTGWLPVDLATYQVGAAVINGDGTETITVRSTVPMRGATSPGKAFLRVEVSDD